MLPVQYASAYIKRASQEEHVVPRVRLGLFGVSVRVVELSFLDIQLDQGQMAPEQITAQVLGGSDSERRLEMMDGLLRIALE